MIFSHLTRLSMLSHSLQDERRHGWVDHLGRREGYTRSWEAWERVEQGLAWQERGLSKVFLASNCIIFRHWGALNILLVQVHWSLKIFGVPVFCTQNQSLSCGTQLCVPCCPYKEKILCFCGPKTNLTHICALPCHPYLLVLVYFSHFHFSSSFL